MADVLRGAAMSGRASGPLVLASRSPQRRAILTQLRVPFRAVAPAFDEHPLDLPPAAVVEARSVGKARSVTVGADDGPVLGVDTEVTVGDGAVLGKPRTAAEAAAMVASLAGRTHHVLSGLCLRTSAAEHVGHAVTAVTFRRLTDDDIADYVALEEWRGRAGGYAVQGVGAALVERVEGCYLNVVGLPVALLARHLDAVGRPLLRHVTSRADAADVAGREPRHPG